MPTLKRMFVPPQNEGGQGGHGIMAAGPQECSFLAEDHLDNNNTNRSTPSKTPDTIDIDPTLTSAAQQPIPSFSSLNGRWPNESSMTILERMRQQSQQGGNTNFFGSALVQELINPDDMSLSPDQSRSSDRPTPNSTASASDRQQGGGGGNVTTGGSSGRSGHNSFETSPASSSAHTQRDKSQRQQQQQNSASRTAQMIFRDFQGAACELPSEMSHGDRQFAAPKTTQNTREGSEAAAAVGEEFSWESFASGGTAMTPGMTPMSEGVLRTMLQMGPMETMDLGWDNPS